MSGKFHFLLTSVPITGMPGYDNYVDQELNIPEARLVDNEDAAVIISRITNISD